MSQAAGRVVPPRAAKAAPSTRMRGEEDAPRLSSRPRIEAVPLARQSELSRLARQVGVSFQHASRGHLGDAAGAAIGAGEASPPPGTPSDLARRLACSSRVAI